MKTLMASFALCVLVTAASASNNERQVGDLGQVGAVEFKTSCDPSLQADFDRGLALLHSFFYDEARNIFTAIAAKDPECAMAHWGVAMTYYHPLWAGPDSADLAAGGAAVATALAAKKQNEHERAYVRAAEMYYKGMDPPAQPGKTAPSCHAASMPDFRGRAACFRREMEHIASHYPDDVDAGAFYALSLVATAPPEDAKLENQTQAAAILEKWYATHPNHPGLAHYLIHAYDYPPLAPKGLAAAQAYASIAPWVPHALHMPSHIFTRLGMWKESIESNLASADAARRYGQEHYPGAMTFDELHALDYALYGYLQTGQDAKAHAVLARVEAATKTYPAVDFAAAYAWGAMPARYVLERKQWKEAAALQLRPMPFSGSMPFSEGHVAYARAVGGAKSGDLAAARAAAERLRELSAASKEPRFQYFADQMEIQRQAALALIAVAEGHSDKGLAMLRSAAGREDSLGKHPVSPGAMLPVRELLADALLENGKAGAALVEFEAALKLNPRRFNAVYGAARAAAQSGKRDMARRHYEELMALASVLAPEDPVRLEVAEAKEYTASTADNH